MWLLQVAFDEGVKKLAPESEFKLVPFDEECGSSFQIECDENSDPERARLAGRVRR